MSKDSPIHLQNSLNDSTYGFSWSLTLYFYLWHVCFHGGVEVDVRFLNSTSCSFSPTVGFYCEF
jgi:hypothetical protein